MASLHRSRRTRPFRQAHRIAPPREVRQAHPRLRARLRPWRSPLALAFVAGVSLLSLVPLPTAFGAAPAERPSNAPAGPTVAAADRAGGPALASAARPADRPSAPSTREGDSRAAPAATVAVVDARPAAADAPRPTGPDTSGPKDQPQRDAGTAADRGVASPPARSSAEPRSATGSKALRTAKAGSSPTPRAARTGTTASAGVAPLRPTVRGSLAGTRPVAGFLGDSYTTGWAGAGIGASGWPALVSTALGLRTSNAAVAGSGFVNPGWTGQPVATRLATVVRADPRIVFVAAGHNDRRFGASAASRAADAVLARLRAALPTSVIVVLGPIWQDGRPPASLVGLRDHLRSTARRVGAVFVDPLAGGWFAGAGHALIGPDGIHPTAAGHRRIAAFVLAALRARGVVAASLRGP